MDNRRQIDQQIRNEKLAKRVISELESRQLSDNIATSELIELCKCAKDIFAKEAVKIRIEAPIVIFGDLHGQYTDLICWLDFVGRPCHSRMLFLGDYVDRGKYSIEV
jgi:serine/threonine-protein phosphatase PP1 catalytic subunit